MGRFVNADTVLGNKGTALDHNLFSYCRQNPVTSSDPSGMDDPDAREYEWQRPMKENPPSTTRHYNILPQSVFVAAVLQMV